VSEKPLDMSLFNPSPLDHLVFVSQGFRSDLNDSLSELL